MYSISNNEKDKLISLLKSEIIKKDEKKQTTEYRDHYNAERLYNEQSQAQVYVSKRANDESNFWKSGKHAYNDETLKNELIYQTTNRAEYAEKEIPEQYHKKDNNMRVTRISEYSNALYNNNVFKNPYFLSC